MAKTKTSIRVDTDLANEAMRVLGTKSKTEAVRQALREIIAYKKRVSIFHDV